MPKIHPTAIVDPGASLADDVLVGPRCLVEADVKIGSGCVLNDNAVIRSHTTMGKGNVVDSFAVLGGEPQDLKFRRGSVSYLKIGDRNTFREGVTISRATGEGESTVVGSGTYWMANAHAGHNAVIEDGVILTNGSLVGGFGHIGPRAVLSAYALVHQFVRVGRLCMAQGGAAASTHVPPYCLIAQVNKVISLNRVGLKRAEDLTDEDRRQIREAFNITYRSSLGNREALAKMDACGDWGAAAGEFRDFVRWVIEARPPYDRGLCRLARRSS